METDMSGLTTAQELREKVRSLSDKRFLSKCERTPFSQWSEEALAQARTFADPNGKLLEEVRQSLAAQNSAQSELGRIRAELEQERQRRPTDSKAIAGWIAGMHQLEAAEQSAIAGLANAEQRAVATNQAYRQAIVEVAHDLMTIARYVTSETRVRTQEEIGRASSLAGHWQTFYEQIHHDNDKIDILA